MEVGLFIHYAGWMGSAGLGCLLYSCINVIYELANCLCPDRFHDQAGKVISCPISVVSIGETRQKPRGNSFRWYYCNTIVWFICQITAANPLRDGTLTAGNVSPISKKPADGYLSKSCHATFVPHSSTTRSEWVEKLKVSRGNVHSCSLCEVWELKEHELQINLCNFFTDADVRSCCQNKLWDWLHVWHECRVDILSFTLQFSLSAK